MCRKNAKVILAAAQLRELLKERRVAVNDLTGALPRPQDISSEEELPVIVADALGSLVRKHQVAVSNDGSVRITRRGLRAVSGDRQPVAKKGHRNGRRSPKAIAA